ncbi:hypothetical protein AB0C76_39885 [Kitasatospora sp. NPDC048722]|uniref:hypothetical protein n=1 Tax=Kitasatospora sp. NPDC048722 TaxID=3155639 RepID=UPI0033CD0C79
MANTAVCEYPDRQAAALLTTPAHPAWSRARAATDAFTARRPREWALLRAITLDGPWSPEELLAATDRLQLHTARTTTRIPALTALAAHGCTHRIRTTTRTHLTA